MDIPLQENDIDCGVFACAYAEDRTRDAAMDLDQNDIPNLRMKMEDAFRKGTLGNDDSSPSDDDDSDGDSDVTTDDDSDGDVYSNGDNDSGSKKNFYCINIFHFSY